MGVRNAVGVVVRGVLLVVLAWVLIAIVIPTPDPFVVVLAWLAGLTAVLAVKPSRRPVYRWLRTGSLRRSRLEPQR